jgi:hypothetical protein
MANKAYYTNEELILYFTLLFVVNTSLSFLTNFYGKLNRIFK